MEIKIREINKELKVKIELLKEEFNEKTSSKAIKHCIMNYSVLQNRYNKVLAEYSNLLRDYQYAIDTIKEIKKR